jgi:hypothetical protein
MSFILSILGLIPGAMKLAEFITGKVFDAKVAIKTAQIGGDRDVARELIIAAAKDNETKVGWLSVVASSPILSFVVVGFAFPFIFYLNKVIVYDLCLGLGSTPTLKYILLENWGGIIISGIFVTSGGAAVAHSYFSRSKG